MINCGKCLKFFEINDDEIVLRDKLEINENAICPDCQLQNALAFWPSIGKWYKRKCDFSGETIITNYPKNSRFPVYKNNYFESDKWDPQETEINFDLSFFRQFKDLQEKVPRPHMLGIGNENCDYCDDSWNSKSCYLSSSMLECENLNYTYRNIRCSDSCDIVFCFDCKVCYSLQNCINCYKVFYASNVEDSSNSMFLHDCRNVRNCFMCWNLRSKEYYILNKKYTKEEYEKKMSELNLGSRKEIEKLQKYFLEQIQENAFHKATMNISCVNVDGNYVQNSKNCRNVSLFQESQNSFNIIRGLKNSDCLSSSGIFDCNLCYYICQSSYLYNVKYSSYSTSCKDSEYLDNCLNCNNCFLCVGLKNKEYCILNKEYPKEEYEKNVARIMAKMIVDNEYGEFLPYNMAYTGYNTTLARFYYAETKDEILKKGGYWEDDEEKIDIKGIEVPDDIKDVSLEMSISAIICTKTSKPFNFSKQAIEFHKKYSIPLPVVSHIERLTELYYPFTFIKPYVSNCYLTQKEIVHYYGKDLGYKKIVSNEAYDKEINS